MSVDDEMKAAIKRVAQAKIAEALGGDVLEKIVFAVMNQRASYGADKRTELERIVHEVIRFELEREVRDFIAKDPAILKAIRAAIREKADEFAISVVSAFASEDWRATLNVHLSDKS